MPERAGPVIGVVGGSGGVGTSTFAAVLAGCSSGVLVDLDCAGGGIDVLLGIEGTPGARWSGLEVAGGRLEPDVLIAGLPRAAGCAVLAADVVELDADAVRQVVGTAAEVGPVVLDLPRAPCAARTAALRCCDLVVVLARADVRGLVSAHAVVSALPEVPLGVVVRGDAVPAADAAGLVGARLVGHLTGSDRVVDPGRPPRRLARVVRGVLAGATPAAAR